MECMSFSRLFMAVTLILIYVIQKLVGRAHQASPMNLKPIHDDMDVRHLAFEDQLQFIDSDDFRTERLLKGLQLDSESESYLSVSVLLFELNERQGCLGAANYSVIRTFSAVNVGQMVLQIRGFKIGTSSSASNILRGRLYDYARKQSSSTPSSSLNSKHQNAAATTPSSSGYHNSDHSDQKHEHSDHMQQNHLRQHQQSVCHGYGFTIYDCEPFDLEPNREHKIRIAFNPDFTLTKSIVSLTILTNLDEEFKFALVASVPRNLLATCNQSLPRPEWEPTMHLILAFGMVCLILVSILIAYMEAMLYLKSQLTTSTQSNSSHTVTTQSNHHNNGGKDCNNYSNHSNDSCNKDRSNGNGYGEAAVASISASISSHQQSMPYALTANGKNNNYTLNTNSKKDTANNNNGNNKGHNNCTQKRRKNSSTANSEKVPTNNSKSTNGSSINEKNSKSSTPYVPIFQNLTNVIASPPPPLPTFDNEYAALEFKKLKGKKSAKKSNSLNGSIASSDDIGNPSSLNQSQVVGSGKGKSNGKANGLRTSASNSINGERDVDLQTQLSHGSRESSQNRKGSLKDVFSTTILSDGNACSANVTLFNGAKLDGNQQEQPMVMPIQPPSSLSSTPSSSISSTTSSTSSSSSSSSTSSSPPLSASSYGEYSLLGPGATFELPCLRVRSAQT